MDVNNYFDLQQLVSEVIGSFELFIILGIILIVWFGIKSNVPFQVQALLIGFWICCVWAAFHSPLYVFVVLIAGIIAYSAFRKYIN